MCSSLMSNRSETVLSRPGTVPKAFLLAVVAGRALAGLPVPAED